MLSPPRRAARLEWLDPIKALALLGVLLNHLVEEFVPGPWFTNPSESWPPLAERLRTIFPVDEPFWIAVPHFLGFLGDAAPGVFILGSGLGLAWARGRTEPLDLSTLRAFLARRLSKLYPAYWLAHLVLVALSVALPVAAIDLASLSSLASLLGTRVGPGQFFHINPSWWFFWTILQLYLAFPFLARACERWGGTRFLVASVLVTVAARGYGLLFVDGLYYWMTGLCGLTRLAEFAVGIWAARHLLGSQGQLPARLATARACVAHGLPAYVAGLACSVFLVTTLLSNLLVTIGLTLLCLAIWHVLRRFLPAAAIGASALGGRSYGIYLLHQVPLKWAVQLAGPHGFAIPAALAVLAASIPAGMALERLAANWQQTMVVRTPRRLRLDWLLAITLLASLLLVEPMLPVWVGRARAGFQVLAISLLLTLTGRMLGRWRTRPDACAWTCLWAIGAMIVAFWMAQPGQADFAVVVTFPFAALGWIACRRRVLTLAPIAAAIAALAVLLACTEMAFRHWLPLETQVWGELPALAKHPTRVFGLKPSMVTRLHYNNYDYVVQTNSEGLNGPEIVLGRPAPDTLRILIVGNAFTMPEGLTWRRAYPALLEEQLNVCRGPGAVQVINGGVTGYSPTEKLPAVRELAIQYRVDVIVDQFFTTELDWMMATSAERLREIGLDRPSGLRVRDRWMSLQLPRRWTSLRQSIYESLSEIPGEWRFGKALLGYYRTGPNSAYSDERAARLQGYYRAVDDIARAIGAKALTIYVPGAVEVQPARTLAYFPWTEELADASRYDLDRPGRFHAQAAAAAGVPAHSLKAALKASPDLPYFADSWHWTQAGHRAAAADLAELLARMQLVPGECR